MAFVLTALAVASAGVSGAAPGAPRYALVPDTLDTDSIALPRDTLVADSLEAGVDSVVVRDTIPYRALRYMPSSRDRSLLASPRPRRHRPLSLGLGNYWRHEIEVDTANARYVAREYVGEQEVRIPRSMDSDDYRRLRLRQSLDQNWASLVQQRERQRSGQRRGGLGFNIVVPGGQQSAFTTIFGRPEVDLRVRGQAVVNAGLDYRKREQADATGRTSQMDPQFKQDLRLGVTGSIGDKMQVDVDWDTNNQFDYQNQLRLRYTGYEDEIIRSIEAGNVMLQTPSRLIRGGQSLFGIKSEFQVGNLFLTTVASQQEGQSNSLSIDGGAQTTEFSLQATDYDDSRHFFLGFFFRNHFEQSLSDPPDIRAFIQNIESIEVWRMEGQLNPEDEDARQVVALVDLGERPSVLTGADGRDEALIHPRNEIDQYRNLETQLRRGTNLSNYLQTSGDLEVNPRSSDFQTGTFKRLVPNRDYTYDRFLGYLSLQTSLRENEAIAVAFRYNVGGSVYTVGEFSTETGGGGAGQTSDRLILKLLRPSDLQQPAADGSLDPAAWYLELRNIYRLPGRGITADNFELDLFHRPPGSAPTTTIAGLGNQTLLRHLGLDRLNQDGAPSPDNQFDFLPGLTVDPAGGRLIFPYLEPFGGRMLDVINQHASSDQRDQLIQQLVFTDLYTRKKSTASRNNQQNVYVIEGSYRGAVQDFYDLQAWAGLVQGSVRVTAGGVPLQEGSDFQVDYAGGTVTITNPAFLSSGRNVEISYEQNSLFNLQKKTLLGVRADYVVDENISFGSTLMRLSQRSPVDKYRIGEEPISNMIYGFDGMMLFEPDWLTRAVDRLPLVQTRAPSRIQLSGEFAQLRPGATHTTAFEQTRRDLRSEGMDFSADELSGVSFIDDFEGFAQTLSLKTPAQWRLPSAPLSVPAVGKEMTGSTADSLRTNWRATFGWYTITEHIARQLGASGPVTGVVETQELYQREDTPVGERVTQTLDVYFDPNERGPYNYTRDLEGFLARPEDAWGGMIQRIPEGYVDFSDKNIEFIEFIFRPHPDYEDIGTDAELIIDLGQISEDVIPNGRLNSEDGLPISASSQVTTDAWGRIPTLQPNNALDIDEQTQRTEDLGLDGLASYSTENYPEELTEQYHFRDFLSSIMAGSGGRRYEIEVNKALHDPSADDYRHYEESYFDDPQFYPEGATIQQRFSRYFAGHELNGLESQRLAEEASRRGVARVPDTEDLNMNGSLDTENSYYEYRLPLSRQRLDDLATSDREPGGFVVEKMGTNRDWYLVRIPVASYTDRVGDIQDFNLIRAIRLWTTGHPAPITMRFAKMDLVGSQWQKSEELLYESDTATTPDENTRFSIESINDEENPDTYVKPLGTIVSRTRDVSGGTPIDQREQAMLLRVEGLHPGDQRAVFKPYRQEGLDLLKYSNLRMFAHLHGRTIGGEMRERGQLLLFVRLGSNETSDYYEYEQPLTPTPDGVRDANALWQTNQLVNGRLVDLNSVNIVLAALNQLKVARDQSGHTPLDVYWNDVNSVDLSPRVEDFAPPGTRLGIKGNPSLGRVNTIMIGVRNPETGEMIESAEVWVNELRVSGYDETNGWSALANADLRFADLATVRGSFQHQTDGFGALSSTLDERDQRSLSNWSVNTEFNAHKLLPERYGWSIPLSVQLRSETSTPRFSPLRGDIRVQELLDQARSREDLSADERDAAVRNITESAQDHNSARSFSASLQKNGSDSWLLRNTLDAVNFSYTYSDRDRRTPSLQTDEQWQWATTVGYRVTSRRARTVRPLWFLDEAPLLGFLGDLRFAYLPQSVSFSTSARRSFSESQNRSRDLTPDTTGIPELVRFPIRQQHQFSHTRSGSIQFNPFDFLNISYDADTRQSLNQLGVDTVFTVHDPGFNDNLTPEELTTASLRVRPFDSVFMQMLKGNELLRADAYGQRVTATLRPTFLRRSFLDFLTFQDIVYSARYSWQNGPLGNNRGASVTNNLEIQTGVTIRPQELWRKFGFYRELEEQQQRAERARRQTSAQDTTGGGSLIDFGALARRTVLAVTSIRDFNIRYRATQGSQATNVGVGTFDEFGNLQNVDVNYSLWQALLGNGPSLGYRLGLERTIPLEQRVFDPRVQVGDVIRNSHRLNAQTSLAPTSRLQINLNWTAEWEDSENRTFSTSQIDRLTTMSSVETGQNRSSIWVFGTDYVGLIRKQVETYRQDLAAHSGGGNTIGDTDGDGRVVLSNRSVVEDFQASFLQDFGTVDGRGFLPLPVPGWTVNYSGLGEWPIIRSLVQNASLRHSYAAEYATDYRTNSQEGEFASFQFVAGQRVEYEVPRYEVGGIRITERYQPLVGLTLGFRNRMNVEVGWSKRNSYSLSTSSRTITEGKTDELTLSLNYSAQGMRLPFFGGRRLNNRLTFTMQMSRAHTDDQRYRLEDAVRAAALDPDFDFDRALTEDAFVTPINASTRTTVTPQISYQFSNRLTANFNLTYEHFDNRHSGPPDHTNISGGFNIRVNIAN